MAVMEMIGEDYFPLSPPPYSHSEDITQKLTSLHQANYVHGDVRDTNIMVKKDGVRGFKLVDFDWSGRGPISNERLPGFTPLETTRSGGWAADQG